MTTKTCAQWAATLLIGLFAMQASAAPGDPLTPPIQANLTPGQNYNVHVDRAPSGEFVVGWAYARPGDLEYDVRARVYAADGTPLSGEINVMETPGNQSRFDIAIADGVMAVAWLDGTNTGNAVRARRFAYDGTPLEAIQPVGTVEPLGTAATPMAALADGGRLAVGWVFERATAAPQSCRYPRLLCLKAEAYDQELRMRWMDDIAQTTLVGLSRAGGDVTVAGIDVLPSPTVFLPENYPVKLRLSGFEVTPAGDVVYLWAVQLAPVGAGMQVLQVGRLATDRRMQQLPQVVELLQTSGGYYCLSEALDIDATGQAVVFYTDGCDAFARRVPSRGLAGPKLAVNATAAQVDRINPTLRVQTGDDGAFSALYSDTLVPFAAGADLAGVAASLGGITQYGFDAASDSTGALVVGGADRDGVVTVQLFEGP